MKLLFIIVITVLNLTTSQYVYPDSFKTHHLNFNVSVDIPLDWKIIDKSYYRQLDNRTEAITGVDQSNNYILIAANCYLEKDNPSATFRISFRKNSGITKEVIEQLTEQDINDLKIQSIQKALEIDKKANMKTDLKSIRVYTGKINGIKSIITEKNILSNNILKKYYLFMIPAKNGLLKINTTYNINHSYLFVDIIKRMLYSLKINKG